MTEKTPAKTETQVGEEAPAGVPEGVDAEEAKGLPNSDRQRTETAVKPK